MERDKLEDEGNTCITRYQKLLRHSTGSTKSALNKEKQSNEGRLGGLVDCACDPSSKLTEPSNCHRHFTLVFWNLDFFLNLNQKSRLFPRLFSWLFSRLFSRLFPRFVTNIFLDFVIKWNQNGSSKAFLVGFYCNSNGKSRGSSALFTGLEPR